MAYFQLKRGNLLAFFLLMNYAVVSQDYFIDKIDSFDLIKNRKIYSKFEKLVDLDSTSFLQILFIQIDNPRKSEAESYYLKIDSGFNLHRCSFIGSEIKKEPSYVTEFYANKHSFTKGLSNDIKAITTTRTSNYIQTPSYFIIKYKNSFCKFIFLNTSIDNALENLSELYYVKEALEFLKAHFNIKFYKILDG